MYSEQQRTISDGSFEQHLPLLEVWGVASQQKSGARRRVLWADHRLGQVGEQLQLFSESLSDHSVLLAQPLYKGKRLRIRQGCGTVTTTCSFKDYLFLCQDAEFI